MRAITYSALAITFLILGLTPALPADAAKEADKPHTKAAPQVELKPVLIEPGAYEIEVSQEAADGTPVGAPVIETHCLTQDAGAGTHGFAVLNQDSVLRSCPSTNLREKGDSLTFEIHCVAGNPTRGLANFTVLGTKFRGRIEVQAGNSAAGAAEVQSGRRIASCPAP